MSYFLGDAHRLTAYSAGLLRQTSIRSANILYRLLQFHESL